MKFTIGTALSSLGFEEIYGLIKSSLLYADEIELIGMVEYAIFRYFPNRINSVKDFDSLMNSFIPFLKSLDNAGAKDLLNQLEGLKSQIDPYMPYLTKNKRRSKQEILAQLQMNKVIKDSKEALDQGISQFTEMPISKEIERLIERNIVSVFDYGFEEFNFDELAGGYFGNLIGVMKNRTAYPLFDKTSNDVISSISRNRILDLGSVNQEGLVHAGLATNLLMTLPTLEKASFDEILSFKKEMEGPLVNFRKAVYGFSEKIESHPWDEDFQYDCLKIYSTEVAPRVEELNELSSETSVLKNMGKRVLADEEIRKKASWAVGGLVTTITTTSNMMGALDAFKDWILGLSLLVVAPNAASAFIKTLSMRNESKDEVKKYEKEMRGNSMYYYYKASKEL